jgi:hypothetical protein
MIRTPPIALTDGDESAGGGVALQPAPIDLTAAAQDITVPKPRETRRIRVAAGA